MRKKINVFLILICVTMVFVLAGCKQDSIKFYRESKVQELVSTLKGEETPKTVKSSGIVIYKTQMEENQNTSGVNFGPKDPDFDMPMKF